MLGVKNHDKYASFKQYLANSTLIRMPGDFIIIFLSMVMKVGIIYSSILGFRLHKETLFYGFVYCVLEIILRFIAHCEIKYYFPGNEVRVAYVIQFGKCIKIILQLQYLNTTQI